MMSGRLRRCALNFEEPTAAGCSIVREEKKRHDPRRAPGAKAARQLSDPCRELTRCGG